VASPVCKLLLIDSEPAETTLLCKVLHDAFPDCKLVVVTDALAFSEQLASGGFSVVISEQSLGWALGIDVLAAFCRHYPRISTILFTAATLPERHSFQQGSCTLACLQKNSAGFLQLVEVVGAALREGAESDDLSVLSSPSFKCMGEAESSVPTDDGLAASGDAMGSNHSHTDRLFALREQSAAAFHTWKIENMKRHFKDEEALLARDIAFLDEEFRITWDEKRELYLLAEQQARLNARYLQTTQQLPIEPDDFLARTGQINSAKRQVIDNFREIRRQNRIKYDREKSAVAAG